MSRAKTWDSIYLHAIARGWDNGYAAHLANEWERKQERKQKKKQGNMENEVIIQSKESQRVKTGE